MFDFNEYPLTSGHANIRKAIRALAKAYTSRRGKLHALLCSAVQHAADNSADTSLVTALWNSLGDEINKAKGIGVWLRRYTNLRQSKAKDGSVQWLKPKADSGIIIKEEAFQTPFWDMPEVKAANNRPFILYGAMESLLNRASKVLKEGGLSEADATFYAFMDKAAKLFSEEKPEVVKKLTLDIAAAKKAA